MSLNLWILSCELNNLSSIEVIQETGVNLTRELHGYMEYQLTEHAGHKL